MVKQMTKRKRDKDIYDALMFREQVYEMEDEVAKFRETGADKEMAADLTRVADSLHFELREHILDLVRHNLGPRQQARLMLVLRTAGELVDAERAELQRAPEQFLGLRIAPNDEAARKLKDVEHFDKFLRDLARDILRMMADHNFEKNRTSYE